LLEHICNTKGRAASIAGLLWTEAIGRGQAGEVKREWRIVVNEAVEKDMGAARMKIVCTA